MGLVKEQKEKLKQALEELELIDLQGEINTKGNYIYLSSFRFVTPIAYACEFNIVLADYTLDANSKNLEDILEALIEKTKEANLRRDIFLEALTCNIKKSNDLLLYECKVTITNMEL